MWLLGSWLREQKRNRQMLPWRHCWTPLQDREGGRCCGWSSVPFLLQWEAPARHHFCSIPVLGWALSCSQNVLPSFHLIFAELFLPISPGPPVFSPCNSHKATPSFPGRDRSCLAAAASWGLQLLLSSPWIMHMSYEQQAQGILEAMEKSSPPPARTFEWILREKSFLLAISSEKLVYPPFPPYIINETAVMNISWQPPWEKAKY